MIPEDRTCVHILDSREVEYSGKNNTKTKILVKRIFSEFEEFSFRTPNLELSIFYYSQAEVALADMSIFEDLSSTGEGKGKSLRIHDDND